MDLSIICSSTRTVHAQAGAALNQVISYDLELTSILKRTVLRMDANTGKVRGTNYLLDRRPELYSSLVAWPTTGKRYEPHRQMCKFKNRPVSKAALVRGGIRIPCSPFSQSSRVAIPKPILALIVKSRRTNYFAK